MINNPFWVKKILKLEEYLYIVEISCDPNVFIVDPESKFNILIYSFIELIENLEYLKMHVIYPTKSSGI